MFVAYDALVTTGIWLKCRIETKRFSVLNIEDYGKASSEFGSGSLPNIEDDGKASSEFGLG